MSPLHIYHRNIRSLRENFDTLIVEFNALNVLSKYSVIILTETWIYEEEQSRYTLDGYTSYLQPRLSGRSGGVMIFVKNDLKCNSKSYATRSFESVAIEIDANQASNHNGTLSNMFTIYGVYRSHHCSVSTFLDDFLPVLSSTRGSSIILGDLNVNIRDQNDHNVSIYIDSLSSIGYLSLHDEVTRPASQTCLDHVFLKSDIFLNCNVKILDCNFCDHCPIELSVDKLIAFERPTSVEIIDYDKTHNFLKDADWSTVIESHSAAAAFKNFFVIIGDIYSKSKKIKLLNSKSKHRTPWVTDNLVNKINKKNDFSKLCKKYPNNTDLVLEFRKLSATVKKEIKSAKYRYYKDEILRAASAGGRNVGKICWRIINNLKGKPKKGIGSIDIHGETVDPNKDPGATRIANFFNEYYIRVAQRTIDESQGQGSGVGNTTFGVPWISQSFFRRDITTSEIIDVINSLKNKSNTNDTILNAIVLKRSCQFLVPILKHLFNLSLQQGYFPPELKHAIVIPIYKKGEKTNVENYRPISLLPTVSKIFEKIVKNLILSFLDQRDFFSNCQFGFLKNKNVNLAIYKQVNEICEAMEGGFKVAGLYIDLKKAFDLVSHDILLDKLYKYGFRAEMYQWFKSYLNLRTQSVKINGSLSNPLTVTYGVPQGSVLGPILFLVFLNDIFLLPFVSKITCFADDTALLCYANSYHELGIKLRSDVAIIHDWFIVNNMVPNSSKTELLIYSLLKIDLSVVAEELGPIYLHNQGFCNNCSCLPIHTVDNVRYLGVNLDSKLNWSKHINILVKRLSKVNYGISYLSKHVTPNLLRVLYYSWFQSVLSFGITHWGGTYSTYFKSVMVSQKNALRTVNGLPFNSRERTQPLFDLWGFLPVADLYRYNLVIFMYKYSYLFELDKTNDRLRQRNYTFKVKPWRKDHVRKQCPFLGPLFYNSLPMSLQNAPTLSRLKPELHHFCWSLSYNFFEN